jgi:hypothetical protein
MPLTAKIISLFIDSLNRKKNLISVRETPNRPTWRAANKRTDEGEALETMLPPSFYTSRLIGLRFATLFQRQVMGKILK